MSLRAKYVTAVFVVLAILAMAVGVAAGEEEGLDLSARSFVIMDAKTGKILLSFHPHHFFPPASTLKVMTALMVRKHLKLDDKVRVSRYAASAPPSKIGIKPGQIYTVKDLLYGLLLKSGNDAARALAQRVSGSEAAFARQLTRQVRQWGAYRTRAATANGLPAEDQYSTAEDLALMFRRAMQDPELAKIMETKYYTIKGNKRLRNHNRFLFTTPLAVAGKTGYTRAARHTYVGMFKNGDHEIIVAAMGSTKKDEWSDLRSLVETGFKLEGAPIAKLPPAEEKLRFARRRYHHRKVHRRIYRGSKRKRRARVVLGSTVAVPAKNRAALKRKPKTQKD